MVRPVKDSTGFYRASVGLRLHEQVIFGGINGLELRAEGKGFRAKGCEGLEGVKGAVIWCSGFRNMRTTSWSPSCDQSYRGDVSRRTSRLFWPHWIKAQPHSSAV